MSLSELVTSDGIEIANILAFNLLILCFLLGRVCLPILAWDYPCHLIVEFVRPSIQCLECDLISLYIRS